MVGQTEIRIVDLSALANAALPADACDVMKAGQRELDQRLDFSSGELKLRPGVGDADKRLHEMVADNHPETREGAEHANAFRPDANLFIGLAQRSGFGRFRDVQTPSGQADL